MLLRVNKYARVDDDEMNSVGQAEEKKGNGGKFDKLKRKMIKENNKVGEEGFKGVNTVFTKPIHKIMFDIKDQPYFEWPKKMGGDPAKRYINLRCSYHRYHGHRTKNCKTLKQFLEKLIGQG